MTQAVNHNKIEELMKEFSFKEDQVENCDSQAVESALRALGNAIGAKLRSNDQMKSQLLSSAEQAKRDLDKVQSALKGEELNSTRL